VPLQTDRFFFELWDVYESTEAVLSGTFVTDENLGLFDRYIRRRTDRDKSGGSDGWMLMM
jgi:hypothetical protein